MICSSYNVNKFKGRKPLNQNVNKTLLVSNAESICENLFASNAFRLRRELSPSQLVALAKFLVMIGKSLFSILFLETYFLDFFGNYLLVH